MLMRLCFILGLMALSSILYSQSTIMVKGTITDEKNHSISDATIVDETTNKGTLSEANGNFSLTISSQATTFRISHIGYKEKKVEITQADLLNAVNHTIQLNITLISAPVEISPVEVLGNKQVRAYDKQWIPIIDFEFSGSDLLLLAYEKKKYDVRLVNNDDSTLLRTHLSFSPESFFKDCLDQLHILSSDSNYRVSILEDTILVNASSSRNDFENVVLPCVAATNKAFYLRRFGPHNQSEFYVESSRESDNERLFATVRDSIGEQLAEEELERVFGLAGYANTQMAEIFSSADLGLSRQYMNDLWFYQKIRTIPIYNPLMKIRDSLYLFNHASGRLSVFDDDGKFSRALQISYCSDKNWNKQIVIDESNDDVYLAFISNGFLTLKKFDLSSGNFPSETQLAYALFPESVRIRNGFAYFLLQHSGEYIGYNLFMQHLN